ncbi:MAG: FmdB family zinc ribbon protein [bacterium]
MPTYEYACESCGYKFTKIQKMNDEPEKICPKCNQTVHRIISGGVGVIFKGSGFYATDYKNRGSTTNPNHEFNNCCSNPKRCCKK